MGMLSKSINDEKTELKSGSVPFSSDSFGERAQYKSFSCRSLTAVDSSACNQR